MLYLGIESKEVRYVLMNEIGSKEDVVKLFMFFYIIHTSENMSTWVKKDQFKTIGE